MTALPCAAIDNLPVELILLFAAAIIAGISKIVEGAREMRRQTAKRMRREEQRAGVELKEPPARRPAPPPVAPAPARKPRRLTLAQRPPAPPPVPGITRAPRRVPADSVRAPLVRAAAPGRKPQPPHPIVRLLRSNRQAVRDAIVLREILGPPVSMRNMPHRRW